MKLPEINRHGGSLSVLNHEIRDYLTDRLRAATLDPNAKADPVYVDIVDDILHSYSLQFEEIVGVLQEVIEDLEREIDALEDEEIAAEADANE